MSPFFIEQFKKAHKCVYCKASPDEGYKCCPKHLKKAKLRFRRWSKERKLQGLCISCNGTSFKGWLRCESHTMENRKKIKAWMALHPDHNRKSWEKRKAFRDSGRCGWCPQHRKLSKGHSKCSICLKRYSLWTKGVKTNKNTPVKVVRALHQLHCRKA